MDEFLENQLLDLGRRDRRASADLGDHITDPDTAFLRSTTRLDVNDAAILVDNHSNHRRDAAPVAASRHEQQRYRQAEYAQASDADSDSCAEPDRR